VTVSKIPAIDSSFSERTDKAIRPAGADFSTVLAQRLSPLTATASGLAARPERMRRTGQTAGLFDAAFLDAGRQYDVSPALLKAVASAESGFNPDAISPAGAVGLMQIMPETAQQLGIDPRDPVQSIQGAASYLRTLLNQFNGNTTLAIAAYNAGPGAVTGYGGVPPFKETQDYVVHVADLMQQYGSNSAGPETGSVSSVPENNGSLATSSASGLTSGLEDILQTRPEVWMQRKESGVQGGDAAALDDLLLIMTEAQGINALSTLGSVDASGAATTEAEDVAVTTQPI
jgi:hypothetical protein